jgi:hypothetical protein
METAFARRSAYRKINELALEIQQTPHIAPPMRSRRPALAENAGRGPRNALRGFLMALGLKSSVAKLPGRCRSALTVVELHLIEHLALS